MHLRRLIELFMAEYEHSAARHRVLVQDVKYLQRAYRARVLKKERKVVQGYAEVIARIAPQTDRKALIKPLTMILFGMINWTFMWFKDRGPLTYAEMAPVVADLFLGGVARVRAPAHTPVRRVKLAHRLRSWRRGHERCFLCDGLRTPFGRYGGALSSVRVDDLAAHPLKALMARHPQLDWGAVDDVYYGCANQAGEDNRNIARMAVLLAGLPDRYPPRPSIDCVDRAWTQWESVLARSDLAKPTDDCRGRRGNVARAFCNAQSRFGFLAHQFGFRHDVGLAFRKRADEGAARHRLDARNGGKRCKRF